MASSLVSKSAAAPPAGGVVRHLPFAGDDAALLAAMRAGSPAALATFHDRYQALVHRTLLGVLGPERELSDLHQDVLVGALGALDRIRDPGALRAWLTSITIFTARTFLRQKARRRWLRFLPWDELPEPAAAISHPEVSEALRATYAILDTLPVDERLAFALRFVEGMELSEAALACGVSLATIKRRIARAEARFTALARGAPGVDPEWIKKQEALDGERRAGADPAWAGRWPTRRPRCCAGHRSIPGRASALRGRGARRPRDAGGAAPAARSAGRGVALVAAVAAMVVLAFFLGRYRAGPPPASHPRSAPTRRGSPRPPRRPSSPARPRSTRSTASAPAPTAPAPSPLRSPPPRTPTLPLPPPRPSWRDLSAAGRFKEALDTVDREGFARLCAEGSAARISATSATPPGSRAIGGAR